MCVCVRGEGVVVVANSVQHHQGDGPTSSVEPVNMGKEERSAVAVVEVEAPALLKSGLSPSRAGPGGRGGGGGKKKGGGGGKKRREKKE